MSPSKKHHVQDFNDLPPAMILTLFGFSIAITCCLLLPLIVKMLQQRCCPSLQDTTTSQAIELTDTQVADAEGTDEENPPPPDETTPLTHNQTAAKYG